jgi:hypothetical protein
VRHFKSNEEFGSAGVRENFLSIHMTVESLLGFGIMQQRREQSKKAPSAHIEPQAKGVRATAGRKKSGNRAWDGGLGGVTRRANRERFSQ